jgi:hypothetical protein
MRPSEIREPHGEHTLFFSEPVLSVDFELIDLALYRLEIKFGYFLVKGRADRIYRFSSREDVEALPRDRNSTPCLFGFNNRRYRVRRSEKSMPTETVI